MKKRKPFLKLLAWIISLTLVLGIATAMAEDAPAPDTAEPGAATDAPTEPPAGESPTQEPPASETPTGETPAEESPTPEPLPGALVTFLVEGEALYLEAGMAVAEGDLLAGVTAVDESGAPVAVILADADGLTPEDPQPRMEGDAATGLTPLPYVLTYTATHPASGETFTQTRECYVAVPIRPLAEGDSSTFDLSTGKYRDGGSAGASSAILDPNNCWLENDTYLWVMDGADITVTGTSAAGSTNQGPRRIVVAGGATAKITLAGVRIVATGYYQTPIALGPDATLTLVLEGTNLLAAGGACAGIQTTGATLIVDSATGGSLEARGGGNGPGPGDGTGAGIGGSGRGDGGTVTIRGDAIVTAVGGSTTDTRDGAAAGIGGGGGGVEKNGADSGTIIIEGSAQVTATGGNGLADGGGAGIGGGGGGADADSSVVAGDGGGVKEIIIRGDATVTAKGGSGGTLNGAKGGGGAGIGGGGGGFSSGGTADGGDGGTITITTTGSVSATGGGSSSCPGSPIGTGGGANNPTADPAEPMLWIATQPGDRTVEPDVPVTLSVAAGVSRLGTVITYKWYLNTADSNTGGTPIDGATSATFTVPTGTAGTFYYYCEIGAAGATTLTTRVATVAAQTYTISASEAVDFGSLRSPYTQPTAQMVTITNTGTGAVTLVPLTSTDYTIGAFSSDATMDNTSDTATFTVRPKANLPVGKHDETLTISGNDGAIATVELTFQVTPPAVVFAVQGSGVNLAKPADLVFEVDDPGLLENAGLTFADVSFMRVTPSSGMGYGQALEDRHGVKYADGLLTIPAAAFGQHDSEPGNRPLLPGQYRAKITFVYGDDASYEYEVDFAMVNGVDSRPAAPSHGDDGDRVADAWLGPDEARPLAAAARRQNLDFANTSRTDRYGVRGKAWAELQNLTFYHDTIGNGLIRVRLYIDNPALFTKDAYVSGYTGGKGVDAAREIFTKWFVNPVRVVHFDQAGDWERPVRAAALVDLKGMDVSQLHFYAYDIASNTYRPLMLPLYRVDESGYLHFNTAYAGDIIVSEGPLQRK